MASVQQRAVAAGFLHALQDPEVFSKWQAATNDPAAVRKVIKDTLGLAQEPSNEDMAAMHAYSETSLTAERDRALLADSSAPRSVGNVFMMVQP